MSSVSNLSHLTGHFLFLFRFSKSLVETLLVWNWRAKITWLLALSSFRFVNYLNATSSHKLKLHLEGTLSHEEHPGGPQSQILRLRLGSERPAGGEPGDEVGVRGGEVGGGGHRHHLQGRHGVQTGNKQNTNNFLLFNFSSMFGQDSENFKVPFNQQDSVCLI